MELELNEENFNFDNKFCQKKKKRENFRLSAKNFFLTYPKCNLSKSDAYDILMKLHNWSYVIIAEELHLDGTPHLHVMLSADKKFSVKNVKFFDLLAFHGNYQGCRDSDNTRNYIMKSDKSPLEFGKYVSNSKSASANRALENKRIIETSLPELIDDGTISMYRYQQIRNAKELYALDKIKAPNYMPKTVMWIYGESGSGKSRYVRDNYEVFYSKPMNKWWDGYKGEKVVLLDDFDLKGECLGHYLKIWGDCYSFNAEIKGGTIQPIIDTFIITSQYLPEQIFCQGKDSDKWDNELVKAIKRRFNLKRVDNGLLID